MLDARRNHSRPLSSHLSFRFSLQNPTTPLAKHAAGQHRLTYSGMSVQYEPRGRVAAHGTLSLATRLQILH